MHVSRLFKRLPVKSIIMLVIPLKRALGGAMRVKGDEVVQRSNQVPAVGDMLLLKMTSQPSPSIA